MNGYYNVRPKYSPGSPAMVNAQTAAMVAHDEKEGHARALEGIYGDDEKAKAEKDSLLGLAEQVTERADAWIVLDLITGDRYVRPFEKHGEKPLQQQNRYLRLSRKYGLPLEDAVRAARELKARA